MEKILTILYLILILMINMVNSQKNFFKTNCGTDFIKQEIREIDLKPIDYNNPLYKRRLQEIDNDGFKNFNIYIDTKHFEKQLETLNLKNQTSLYINPINKAKETLQKLLKVKALEIDFNFDDEDLTDYVGIDYWDKEKFGTEAYYKGINFFYLGIDLVIFPVLEEMESGILAAATSLYGSTKTYQPIVGKVFINTNLDFLTENFDEYFQSVILHEFTHVLGFNTNQFYFSNFLLEKEDTYYLNSTKVLQVAKKYFNCSDMDGVALENYGSLGTFGSHWEARILLGEYMNGYIFPEEQVISEFTLAFLEDTGNYKAKYYSGGLMRYGKNKGCSFLNNKCLNSSNETDPNFENEFFDSIHSDYSIDNSCSSGRQSRTYSALYYYNETNETEMLGYGPADFCPIFKGDHYEQMFNYYIGHCSNKGSGDYGLLIQNKDSSYNISEEVELITGETYSDHSFCYLSSLIKKEENKIFNYSDVVRAVCFETFCSSKSLTVKIHNDFIVCPREGGKVEIENYDGYFLCPDYNLICSGTILCNNMFDCVDKKSEIKEDSYIYDYEIKTSQNIDRAEEQSANSETNYELSIDGKCPQYCSYCIENECKKCKNEFFRVKKGEKIICLSKNEVETGYYLKEFVYYQCLENCKICSNETVCQECKFGFENKNNTCVGEIENCEEYNNNDTCKKCKNGYGFKEDERNHCTSINSLDTYYSKDNGISYYLCNNDIKNCKKCNYNGILECNECQNEFVILDDDRSKCYSKNEINNKTYYYINDTHANTCSKVINNCILCENENKCIKCEKDFYFLNNITSKCYNISEIYPLEEYYLDENNSMYYSCKNIKFNSIANCKNCSGNGTCSLCNYGYTFVEGDKTKCVYKISLYGKYYLDPEDPTNYISCDSSCEKCDDYDGMCVVCKDNYGIFNYSEECVLLSNFFNKSTEYNMYLLGIEPFYGYLNLYILIDYKLPNDFRLTIPVIYNFKNSSEDHYRNLQNIEEYNITFYPDNYNFFSLPNIVVFDHIEYLPYYDYDLSEISLNLDKIKDNKNGNINYKLHYEHVEYFRQYAYSNLSKINESKIYRVIDISKGKKFNMITIENITTEKEIIIKFEENGNSSNIIEANCTLSKKNGNIIPCSSNSNINNYKLKDYFYIDKTEGKIILITKNKTPNFEEYIIYSSENLTETSDNLTEIKVPDEGVQRKKSSGSGVSSGVIAIIIVAIVALIAIAVTTIIIICKKKKKDTIKKGEYDSANSNSNISNMNNSASSKEK